MRNLLAFFAACCLTFCGMGWYLGWYKVQTTPTVQGKRSVNIEINTVKIGEDIARGSERLQEMLSKDGKAQENDKTKAAATAKEGKAHSVPGGAELSEHP